MLSALDLPKGTTTSLVFGELLEARDVGALAATGAVDGVAERERKVDGCLLAGVEADMIEQRGVLSLDCDGELVCKM